MGRVKVCPFRENCKMSALLPCTAAPGALFAAAGAVGALPLGQNTAETMTATAAAAARGSRGAFFLPAFFAFFGGSAFGGAYRGAAFSPADGWGSGSGPGFGSGWGCGSGADFGSGWGLGCGCGAGSACGAKAASSPWTAWSASTVRPVSRSASTVWSLPCTGAVRTPSGAPPAGASAATAASSGRARAASRSCKKAGMSW